MKPTPVLVAAGLLVLGGLPAAAQMLFAPGDVTSLGTWQTYDIRFLTDRDQNTVYQENLAPAGMDRIQVALPGGGAVTAWDLCVEFFIGPNPSYPYTVTPGLGAYSVAQQAAIRTLISNAFPLFDAARTGGTQSDAEAYASAIQMCLWEIIEESNSYLVLDHTDVNAGIFQVDAGHPTSDLDTPPALAHAAAFLANIRSGSWTDQGGINYYIADPDPAQRKLWFTTEVIPEPSTGLLALLGLAFAGRRRR